MKTIILILLIGIVSCNITAQTYDLLGIVDSELIKINSATNDIEVVGILNPTPSNVIRLLTYVEEDCMIYAIMVKANRPWLISIDLNLNFTEIGMLNVPGSIAYFCEGLAYNLIDNKLYAAVSLDGSTSSGDYASETIVEVDRSSGTCSYVTEIIGNVSDPDIDRMSFIDNILYFCDGAPGQWLKFFELDFSSLNFTTQAVELLSVAYTPIKDAQSKNDNVYYTNGTDLLFFDPGIQNITNEGILFDISEFNGEVITGICLNPFPDYLALEDEIEICEEGDFLLVLDYPYDLVTWNNGAVGNSIIINETGLYWADVVYNNCTFRTDTIEITYIDPIDFNIGTSVSLCPGETLVLDIGDPNVSVTWSDGSSGTELVISEPGLYWANYIKDGCEFNTDTINVEVVDVNIEIPSNIELCYGESYTVSLEGVGQNISWNNGYTGNNLIITEPGLYWAVVTFSTCEFLTDTIEVSFIEPVDNFTLSDTTICIGETIYLTFPDPNFDVIWNDGTTENEIAITEEGYYWLQYTQEGCTFFTDTFFVEVVEVDIEIASYIELCANESYTVSLEGVGQNISWNNGYTGNNLIITEPGLYWAVVTVNNCEFLTNTIEVSFIEPVDNFTVSDTTICNGETIYLTFPEPNIDVIWSDGSTENEIAIAEEGYYWLQYVKDGCTYFTDTFFVNIVDAEYDIGSDITLCEGESYLLNLEGVGQNISWNNGYTGSQLILNEAGAYWAEIILDNCQFITNTITVTILPTAITDIGSDTIICDEAEVVLSIQNPILNYQWNTGELGNSIIVYESGTYWATVINYECPSNIDSIEVAFIPDPTLTFDIDTILCEADELIFPHYDYGVDINWQNANEEELFSIIESGTYWGTFQIENCSFYTDTIVAEFVDCTPCTYYLPNVISPNFDGINDEFKVVFSNTCFIKEIEMMIYDRWGNLVSKSNDNAWDGMFNSKIVVNGVYVYSINMVVQMYNGVEQEINVKGDITILK